MRATNQPQLATELTRFIGTKVRELRKAQKMSQEALADRVCESIPAYKRATVMRIEVGQRESITVDELIAIARSLDVHYTELLPDQPELPDSVKLFKMSQEMRKIAERSKLNDRLDRAWRAVNDGSSVADDLAEPVGSVPGEPA